LGDLKSAIGKALVSGYQLTPEACAALGSLQDPEVVIQRLIDSLSSAPERPLFIGKADVERAAGSVTSYADPPPTATPSPRLGEAEREGSVGIISGGESGATSGKISDFKSYFNDRFLHLYNILRARGDMKDATTPSKVVHNGKWQKVKLIGMVASKRDFKDGAVSIELEDPDGSIKVSVKPTNDQLRKKAARLMLDEVVCITGGTKSTTSISADDIIWPEISFVPRTSCLAGTAYAVFTSDIHVGSKMFMKENFQSFIKWLRGEYGDEKSQSLASKVKYLVIAGDLVDGVGIYPSQEEELEIVDLYKQYESAAEYLAMVPEGIRIIIIPGNHDACRPTLPTPPMYRDYADPVYSLKNVTMLGDPAQVALDGVKVLITHGRSLDDTIPAIPGCDFRNPQRAMIELLKSRHIAPIYGEKTPLAPEPFDRLVIDPVPNIFHAGHVHVEGIAEYRGVLAINSGTWQAQTKFQMSMGIVPKTCVVPVVDLSTFKAMELSFN